MPKREAENHTDSSQPNDGFGVNYLIGSYGSGPISKLLGERGGKNVAAGRVEQTGS